MKIITAGRVPLVLALLCAPFSGTAFGNSFAIVPVTNTFPFTWSVNIDNAAAQTNPELQVLTGQTYTFSLTGVAFHPFWIDRAPGIGGALGSDPYPYPSEALSDNGVSTNKTITMNLPADAPDTLYYACGVHSSMFGTIHVIHDLVFRASFD